jgi:acyl-homoserine lactone acylase PvdQ
MKRRTFLSSTGALAGARLLSTGTASAILGDPHSSAEIRTDKHNISHLYSDDLYDLVFANGYVQARDRLFEMDVLRHVGYGNSAAVIGEAQLQSDIEVRRDLYSKEEINRQYENASERTKQILEAFADGVNRKMIEFGATGQLPGEFTALAHAPEPWKPEDSIAVLSYLIGRFGIGGGNELSNARMFARLKQAFEDDRAAYEAFGDRNWLRIRENHYTSIPEEDLTVDGGEDVLPYEDVPDEQLQYVDAALGAEPWGIEIDFSLDEWLSRDASGIMEGFKFGSNALIVGGEHTQTGKPMLGGGPQMGYFKPPVIHQVGLHGAGFDVTGIGVVGTPGVIIGRTPEFAWTVTSGRDDQVDTIAVDLHPDDKHRYQWNGEWHEMTTETVTHHASIPASIVNGDPDVRIVTQEIARIEENGAVMPVVAWNPDERVAWCQRTTTRYQELEGAFMWANLGMREDLDGFKDQLSEFPFTFNFHYIDDEDIAYIHTGKVPDRNSALDHRLPAPGSAHQWRSMQVGLELGTHYTNPSRGYVVNWNNGPCAGWRAGDPPQQWGSIHRAELLDRFTQQALDNGPLSLDDVEQIIDHASTHDAAAPYTVPMLIDVGRMSRDPQLQAIAAELEIWKGTDYEWRDENNDRRYDSGGMAIWEETRRELQSLVFSDELGDQTPAVTFDPPMARHAADHGRAHQDTTLVDALTGRTAHDWFVDVAERDLGDGTNNWSQRQRFVLRRALQRAATTLEKHYGSVDPADWQLEVRKSTFRSLGASTQTTIEMINRASYNQSIAMGKGLDGSKHVLPPSNTGHLSFWEVLTTRISGDEPDRLTDQLDEYVNFEYIPHPYTREQVEQLAVEEQTLQTVQTSLNVPIQPSGTLPTHVKREVVDEMQTDENDTM